MMTSRSPIASRRSSSRSLRIATGAPRCRIACDDCWTGACRRCSSSIRRTRARRSFVAHGRWNATKKRRRSTRCRNCPGSGSSSPICSASRLVSGADPPRRRCVNRHRIGLERHYAAIENGWHALSPRRAWSVSRHRSKTTPFAKPQGVHPERRKGRGGIRTRRWKKGEERRGGEGGGGGGVREGGGGGGGGGGGW